ncbi:MAG: ChbG/HpnK family deacetylase [Burkholderiaceae bacterium]|nr:ChbG/HpnK family deacetylase [Burkholderiaceae bacterium]
MSRDPATRVARRWVVCADDFGLDRGTIDGTIALIKLGRVTATSVLADSPNWRAAAPQLKELSGSADIGLHLNLTEALDSRGRSWSLPRLVVQSQLRLLPRWRVHDHIQRQLDAFTDGLGRLPDFIDGHQHVHQLPVVREVLVESVLMREPKTLPWMRVCLPPEGDSDYKARVIGLLGAGALAELARSQGFPTSKWLVGSYGFQPKRDTYMAKVRWWLHASGDGTVFMCHPSTRPSSKDPIGPARRMELGVLAGQAYADALSNSGVTVARGTTIFRARASKSPPPGTVDRAG